MFISPSDHYAPAGALHLVWSFLGISPGVVLATLPQLAPGTAVLIDKAQLWALQGAQADLRLFVKEDGWLVRLSSEGKPMDRFHLIENELPSQIAAHGRHDAVALDIVMAESTQAAWLAMEDLTGDDLPTAAAAAALVGTASEIARRLEDYRAGGVRHIVLTATPDRAPYEAVRRELVPLLRQRGTRGGTEAPAAAPGTTAITWHGVAL